jgi:GH43 family beta-xylosidase
MRLQNLFLALPLFAAVMGTTFGQDTGTRPAPTKAAPKTAKPMTFRNPLKQPAGADPWVGYHDGWYYLSATTATDVRLRRARRLSELPSAPDQIVWKDDTPTRFRDMWAPEFFLLDSGNGPRWYLYYTASDGKEDSHHRMYVVESAGTDPMGPYTFKAQLQTDPKNEQYAIDGSVLKMPDGTLYFVWCGRPSPTGQGIYISRMSNPWTLTGERTYLPADGFGCNVVREGPVTLVRNGRVFLIYSTCPADTPDYKLGMLIADVKSDLLNSASWKQHPRPVFARVDQYGVFGPGHNSFFKSPDGKEDWIVYHAKSGTKITYGDRTARAQKFTWDENGLPDFGLPLPLDRDIPSPSGEPPATP